MTNLTNEQDAFGHLLDDHLRGAPGREIVERDDGFIGVGESSRAYVAPYHAWLTHDREAMAWARSRILDVGCGAGRHALYLQGQGAEVVGIDVSPLAIDVCQRRGLRDARVLSLANASLLTTEPGSWDTLLLLGANVGLFGDAATARTLLTRLYHATSDDARIIAESRDPHGITAPVHAAYRDENLRRGRMPGQLRLRIRYKQYATPWFEYLFVSKPELERLLEGTGWAVTRYLDAATGEYIALVEKVIAARSA